VDAGFPKRSCSNKKLERDDDSKKSHPALELQKTQALSIPLAIFPAIWISRVTSPHALAPAARAMPAEIFQNDLSEPSWILFLCSPRGKTISGQAISICGDTQMLG
jgi:hypothetical protein